MQIQIWKAWTWRRWVGSGSLGLLEGYGGQFEAAEHGGKAVDIDSTSYMCAMCVQCLYIGRLGACGCAGERFCLSVCL